MEKELEKLAVRIVLYENSTLLGYIYNREVLNASLKIEIERYDNSQLIGVGEIVEMEGVKYEVKSISLRMHENFIDIESMRGAGMNLLSPTPPTNYNCDLNVSISKI